LKFATFTSERCMCMWILFVLLCVWNHTELGTRSIFKRCVDTSHLRIVWGRRCHVSSTLPSSDPPKTSTDTSTSGWLDVCYVTRRPYGAATNVDTVAWRPLTRDGHPSSLNSERMVTAEKSLERGQSSEDSPEVSLDEDVEQDTSATLYVGGPVVYWLMVEPTVVLPQKFIERWFSGGQSRRIVEARRPVF